MEKLLQVLWKTMAPSLLKLLLPVLVLSLTIQRSDGQDYYEEWCIADVQTPDDVLKTAMEWACGNGANCTNIQDNQPCFFPNTTMDHASFAFNSYYQKMKHNNGTCYFNAAALVSDLDPSHDSCKFEVLP